MIRIAAAAALAGLLAGCAAPKATINAVETPAERRWPTALDTRLCPTEDAAKLPYYDCVKIREPYRVVGKGERRDRLAYHIETQLYR